MEGRCVFQVSDDDLQLGPIVPGLGGEIAAGGERFEIVAFGAR